MSDSIAALQFPIGKFQPKESYTPEEVAYNIGQIKSLPQRLNELVSKFTTTQFDQPYRPEGWTGRQVIHHLADSHINAYIRTKWTLTEETPLIKAYLEKNWAETPEIQLDPQLSIAILTAIHARWTALLELLTPEQLKRGFIHPETGKLVTLERQIALYAWHSNHHLGHLQLIAG